MEMDVRYPDIEVPLIGEDGNAFAILGRVARELRRSGHGADVNAFMADATSGDFDHLLRTIMRWVQVV